MQNKKIFILGAAHSGTTILYNMLAYHNELAWFSQFSQRDKHIPNRKKLLFSNVYKRLMRQIIKHSWQKVNKKKWIPFPSEAKIIWDYVFSPQNILERENLVKRIIDDELKSWWKNSILFKKPSLGNYIDFFQETFGSEAYFIHIVRDGRAVILSDLHKFYKNCSSDEALDKAINYWNDYINAIDNFKTKHKNAKIIEIKYEDFIAYIHFSLKKVFEFCELNNETFDFNLIPKSLRSMNDKWINEDNSEFIERIEFKITVNLKKYNYVY